MVSVCTPCQQRGVHSPPVGTLCFSVDPPAPDVSLRRVLLVLLFLVSACSLLYLQVNLSLVKWDPNDFAVTFTSVASSCHFYHLRCGLRWWWGGGGREILLLDEKVLLPQPAQVYAHFHPHFGYLGQIHSVVEMSVLRKIMKNIGISSKIIKLCWG